MRLNWRWIENGSQVNLTKFKYFKRSFNSSIRNRNYEKDQRQYLAEQASQVVNGIKNEKQGGGFKKFLQFGLSGVVTGISVYVGIQTYEGREHIFVPLWIDCNWIWQSKYRFPDYLKYFDNGYLAHIKNDMETENRFGRDYFNQFQESNIKYKVLEEMGKNRALKKYFQFPVHLHTHKEIQYDIWIECPLPSISGIDIQRNDTLFGISWTIKPLDIWGFFEDAMVAAGLKLDRLQRSEATQKTHEKGLGKIHEIPIVDEKIQGPPILNGNKLYLIIFDGTFIVNSKAEDVVHYRGTIDFDHLMINRGVKITDLLIEKKDVNGEIINIKVV